MPLVGSIDILNMHSVKMHSLGSGSEEKCKKHGTFFHGNFFPSILLYMVVLIILSNFHYQFLNEIRHPSWRNRRIKKTDSYSSLQSGIQISQSRHSYVSRLTDYKKDQIHEPGLMKFWAGEWNLDPQFQKKM